MIFGSRVETAETGTPIATNFGNIDFKITADQVSETYTVASIADTLELASASTVSENYISVINRYEETGTIASTINNTTTEKPTVIDTSDLSRGIISYTVKDGDTLDTIADAYGVSKDHIRWSNGMKKEDVEVGKVLLIPSVDGIVYKVKDGDTLDSLAEKYGSNKDEIIAYNDLEGSDISTDAQIILPGGNLPEKDRPEYVAPTPTPVITTPRTTYAYGSYGVRQNISEVGNYGYWANVYYSGAPGAAGNPGAFGNCTWFAWYWRNNAVANGALPGNYALPGGAIGNARDWAWSLGSRGFVVNQTPAYGAIQQDMGGYYGHVAVVVGVDPGVSVTIQEMNFAGPNGQFNHVYQSTMDWSYATSFNYIHGN